jgi:GTPase-associated protein 1, N-terminal domain type 2
MHIEHAVFTSASTRMGQGYRIVAASAGITAAEKQQIATSSPSHEAMCDAADDAVGIAFYRLPSGRFCVARTCHAGLEQTGRGGKRVLTRAYVVSVEQLDTFGFNPFALLHAVSQAQPESDEDIPSGTLEPIDVSTDYASDPGVIHATLDAVGESAWLYLLSRTMTDGCLIVANHECPATVLESVFLGIPRLLRAQCTFSIGLKFALSRRLRFHVVSADLSRVQRSVRGQDIDCLEDLKQARVPDAERHLWTQLASDCCQTGCLDSLVTLTDLPFDETDVEAMEDIARLQMAMNHLPETPFDQLLNTWTSQEPESPSKTHALLRERYAVRVSDMVMTTLESADEEFAKAHWPRLTEIAALDARINRACTELSERFGSLESCMPQPQHQPVAEAETSPPPERRKKRKRTLLSRILRLAQ